jgi:hypothetical protein
VGREVEGGDLQAVEEDAGSFEVHLVGCDADQDIGHGSLDGGAIDGWRSEREAVVGEDVGHVVDDVVEAGVFVVAGVGAAADAVVVDPDALVWLGRLLLDSG